MHKLTEDQLEVLTSELKKSEAFILATYNGDRIGVSTVGHRFAMGSMVTEIQAEVIKNFIDSDRMRGRWSLIRQGHMYM